jgi:hypothetical protein
VAARYTARQATVPEAENDMMLLSRAAKELSLFGPIGRQPRRQGAGKKIAFRAKGRRSKMNAKVLSLSLGVDW